MLTPLSVIGLLTLTARYCTSYGWHKYPLSGHKQFSVISGNQYKLSFDIKLNEKPRTTGNYKTVLTVGKSFIIHPRVSLAKNYNPGFVLAVHQKCGNSGEQVDMHIPTNWEGYSVHHVEIELTYNQTTEALHSRWDTQHDNGVMKIAIDGVERALYSAPICNLDRQSYPVSFGSDISQFNADVSIGNFQYLNLDQRSDSCGCDCIKLPDNEV